MSKASVTSTEVPVPVHFVEQYLLDVQNWPQIYLSPLAQPTIEWTGVPWSVGSVLVISARMGMRFTGRYEVLPADTDELFRLLLRYAGSTTEISTRLSSTDGGTLITTEMRFGGFLGLVPKSSTQQAHLFSERRMRTALELAWRRHQLAERTAKEA